MGVPGQELDRLYAETPLQYPPTYNFVFGYTSHDPTPTPDQAFTVESASEYP